MSRILTWSDAQRSDRADLPAFTCTDAPQRKRRAGRWEQHHDRPWELRPQAALRTAHPPAQPPDFMLVGRDAEGIGAAMFYEELDGPGLVELHIGAVAMRHRFSGSGVADEMMAATFDAITTRALEAGVDLVEIGAWIDPGNRGSQAMCRRATMRQTAVKDDLQRWGTVLLVAGADFDEMP